MEFLSFITGLWLSVTGFLGFNDGAQSEVATSTPEDQAIEEPAPEAPPANQQPLFGVSESTPENTGVSSRQGGQGELSGPPSGGPGGGFGGPRDVAGGPPGSGPGGSGRPSGGPISNGSTPTGPGGGTNAPGGTFTGGGTQTISSLSLPDSDFLGSYSIDDATYGTDVTVTISGNTRTIVANALPNHPTGAFPNSGNPHSIEAQSRTYTFPASGSYTGNAVWVREPGVGVNGVKFEPETAEVVSCSSGESYKIEAFQNEYDLGFDENNAHVQPTGEYHYHGFPTELVELYDDGSGLIHIGFAEDGNLIYYDDTGTVKPSWQLSNEARSGTSCTYRNQTVAVNGTAPDGTFVSDWEYVSGSGNLDACNGAYVDGEYVYFVTEEYPYVSRCLQGSF